MNNGYNITVLNAIDNGIHQPYTPKPQSMRIVDALRAEGYHIVSTPEVAIDYQKDDLRFGEKAGMKIHLGMEVDDKRLSYSRLIYYVNFQAVDWLVEDMARHLAFKLLEMFVDET